MAYEGFKELNRRSFADKVSRGKIITFGIGKDPKCDGYQRGLA